MTEDPRVMVFDLKPLLLGQTLLNSIELTDMNHREEFHEEEADQSWH